MTRPHRLRWQAMAIAAVANFASTEGAAAMGGVARASKPKLASIFPLEAK